MGEKTQLTAIRTKEDFRELVWCIKQAFRQGFKYRVQVSYEDELPDEPQYSFLEYKFIFQRKIPKENGDRHLH